MQSQILSFKFANRTGQTVQFFHKIPLGFCFKKVTAPLETRSKNFYLNCSDCINAYDKLL